MLIYLPQLVLIVGLILYFVTKDKPAEIGRVMFWTGLLATLLNGIHHP